MKGSAVPEWMTTAPIIAALIAAIGYVAKLVIEELGKWRTIRTERRARLVTLQSLLFASRRVFEIQNTLVQKLCDELDKNHPGLYDSYDQILSACYPLLTPSQKDLHGVIRAYTISAMRPLNDAMVQWLATDRYFTGNLGTGAKDDLASSLQTLEAHLLLWRAKYDFWIVSHPDKAIVYMADEDQHGAGFPTGIEDIIARETGGRVRT
jgi:hypothetical protein